MSKLIANDTSELVGPPDRLELPEDWMDRIEHALGGIDERLGGLHERVIAFDGELDGIKDHLVAFDGRLDGFKDHLVAFGGLLEGGLLVGGGDPIVVECPPTNDPPGPNANAGTRKAKITVDVGMDCNVVVETMAKYTLKKQAGMQNGAPCAVFDIVVTTTAMRDCPGTDDDIGPRTTTHKLTATLCGNLVDEPKKGETTRFDDTVVGTITFPHGTRVEVDMGKDSTTVKVKYPDGTTDMTSFPNGTKAA